MVDPVPQHADEDAPSEAMQSYINWVQARDNGQANQEDTYIAGYYRGQQSIEAVRRERRAVVILEITDLYSFARGDDTEHMAGTRIHADANVQHFLATHLSASYDGAERGVVVDGEQDGDHHQPSATVAE